MGFDGALQLAFNGPQIRSRPRRLVGRPPTDRSEDGYAHYGKGTNNKHKASRFARAERSPPGQLDQQRPRDALRERVHERVPRAVRRGDKSSQQFGGKDPVGGAWKQAQQRDMVNDIERQKYERRRLALGTPRNVTRTPKRSKGSPSHVRRLSATGGGA